VERTAGGQPETLMESISKVSSPLSDRSTPSQAGVLGVQVISGPGLWRSKLSIPSA